MEKTASGRNWEQMVAQRLQSHGTCASGRMEAMLCNMRLFTCDKSTRRVMLWWPVAGVSPAGTRGSMFDIRAVPIMFCTSSKLSYQYDKHNANPNPMQCYALRHSQTTECPTLRPLNVNALTPNATAMTSARQHLSTPSPPSYTINASALSLSITISFCNFLI